MPLSTKGNAIYGKGPQKNLGGEPNKEEVDSGRSQTQFSQCAEVNMSVCGMETK